MNTAELIYQKAKEIPELDAREVLDFMERLQAKRGREAAAGDKPVTAEEHAAWCERLRQGVESQPMTEGDSVAKMRQEARY